jgi:hypothetical protein
MDEALCGRSGEEIFGLDDPAIRQFPAFIRLPNVFLRARFEEAHTAVLAGDPGGTKVPDGVPLGCHFPTHPNGLFLALGEVIHGNSRNIAFYQINRHMCSKSSPHGCEGSGWFPAPGQMRGH